MLIVVANQKGGVGKTTTALTLAHLLDLEGEDVAVVDLDAPSERRPFANAQTAAYAREIGIEGYLLDQAPIELPEHVIADCPPDLANPDFRAFAEIADLVLMPTTPKRKDLEISMAAADYVREHLRRPAAFLLTMVHPNSSGPAAAIRKELRDLGYRVLEHDVTQYAAYDEADAGGTTVAGHNTVMGRRAAKDYLAVLHELRRLVRELSSAKEATGV